MPHMPISKQGRIAFIGEPLGELKFNGGNQVGLSVGGDVFNAAVYAQQVNSQMIVEFWSAIGRDAYSAFFTGQCHKYGVSTRMVGVRDDLNIGLYLIETDKEGERRFNYWRSDSACRHYLDNNLVADLIENTSGLDAVYLSGITLAIMSDHARGKLLNFLAGPVPFKIYFDDNYRAELWASSASCLDAYHQIIGLADVSFLSLQDELSLFGLAENKLFIWLKSICGGIAIVRNGRQPIRVLQAGEYKTVSVQSVDQVDTTAGGDSFSGAFIGEYFRTGNLENCIGLAKSVSGYVVSKPGALVQVPFL